MSEYLSNLTCPDLRPYFPHLHWHDQQYAFGRSVPSDWADKADDDPVFGLYKRCGLWCREEAAILYNIAESIGGEWLDIGAHTGWTSAHIAAAGADVIAVEPMFWLPEWRERFAAQADEWPHIMPWAGRSEQFFEVVAGNPLPMFDGIVIDGDHEPVCVERDVIDSQQRLKAEGVIILHDFIGAWDCSTWLLDAGFKCRVYLTPHVLGVFWRGDWTPPEHVPDPAIDWQEIKKNHMRGFPWERTV